MAHIRVIHDPAGETLTVYWAEPRADQVCEETGEGAILIKDAKTQEVIGFVGADLRVRPVLYPVCLSAVPSVKMRVDTSVHPYQRF